MRDDLGEHPGQGAGVSAMTLEHYAGMTERQLEAIEAEARGRWPLHESTGYAIEGNVLAPVPEPETWAMLLAGLGITGWAVRRRQQPSSSHQLAA
mgnify:CR=1 FL=1